MFNNTLNWITQKWKALAAFAVLVTGAFMMYLRTKNQKRVLDVANKSHEKENEANEIALKDLTDGLEEIHEEEKVSLKKSEKKHEKLEKDLAEKKEDFIKSAEINEDLAKEIADKIGADFVDLSKK